MRPNQHKSESRQLFADAFPWLLPPPAPFTVAPQVLAGYAGTYAYPDGRSLRITARGGQLFGELAGYAERELLPVSATEFRLPQFRVSLRFSGAPAGTVTVWGDGPTVTATRTH